MKRSFICFLLLAFLLSGCKIQENTETDSRPAPEQDSGHVQSDTSEESGPEKENHDDTVAGNIPEEFGLTEQNYDDIVPKGISAASDLYQRAKEMSLRYNVDIRIADQCQLDYSHYSSYEVNDRASITHALDELETALSTYPEGFFRQLCYGDIRRIQIELVGGLAAKEGSGVGDAAAFAQELSGYYLLVADVFTTYSWSYYHEFTHILDNRLAWDTCLRADALFSEDAWAALQPEGFQYAMSYTDMPDSVRKHVNSGYFMAEYSCTFPTEDRATMMEAAMTNATYEFQTKPGLRAKLEYYCRCIRDCLNTDGWPEMTAWETILADN